MSTPQLLWPAFVLFLWTQLVVLRLATLRFRAVREKRVDPRYYKVLRGEPEPEDVAVVARNLANLCEAPTLFYAGIAVAIALLGGAASTTLVATAWIYVALRLLHSLIHLTVNKVIWRFRAFALSWLALLVFWVLLVAQALSPGPPGG